MKGGVDTHGRQGGVDPILTKIVKTIENEFFSLFFGALLEEKHTIPFNRLTNFFPVFLGRGESDISPYLESLSWIYGYYMVNILLPSGKLTVGP